MNQDEALNILKLGKNVFLTGAAGSGKTYVLNQYIKYLKKNKVNVAITASTGIAATHMNGKTIHSWAHIGIKDSLSETDLNRIFSRTDFRMQIMSSPVLIIDEISMLHDFR
ncbi:MAG: AAA family ATPase, partial [bacterium]